LANRRKRDFVETGGRSFSSAIKASVSSVVSTPQTAISYAGNYAIPFLLCCLLAGCGYHVAGHYSNLPANLQTIAVPAFKNDTTRYRIEQRMTEAVIRQFIERTKFHIVQDPAAADAVLRGEVLSVNATPMLFNATTGEVTMMLVTVHSRVTLIDTRTQKSLYHANDMVFRQEYQISTDVQSFFQEQDPAFDRMSRDFASRVVSNILEGF
jgi:outer membrane lipopolysaccharide assembly protein LptE/RlpB